MQKRTLLSLTIAACSTSLGLLSTSWEDRAEHTPKTKAEAEVKINDNRAPSINWRLQLNRE